MTPLIWIALAGALAIGAAVWVLVDLTNDSKCMRCGSLVRDPEGVAYPGSVPAGPPDDDRLLCWSCARRTDVGGGG